MKGWSRPNVAKLLTVDMLIEIPVKTIYGILFVCLARLYMMKYKDTGQSITAHV